MKYWCYYTDVVRYLERIEALYSQKKTQAPAYLVWQDDDGPSMIAGPGIEWHRGDGPPPDIDAINLRARRRPSRKANKRSTNFPKPAQTCSHLSKKQQRRGRKSTLKTPNPLPTRSLRTSDTKRANRSRRLTRKKHRTMHPKLQGNLRAFAATASGPRASCWSGP